MRIRKILPIIIIALLVSTAADAQKRRAKKKKVEVVEETLQEKMYKNMLPSTQVIMFVDSVDATKDDFIKYIKLPGDIGRIVSYADFFNSKDTTGCMGFVNGFGNSYFFAVPDGKGSKLYTAEKIGPKWDKEREIKELNDFSANMSFPYMMTDGATLYFAAKNYTESLGGYDIFVTRYDSDTGTFLEPQNIGTPFNSPANDYMFVVDDVNNIGWFVTDRNKKDGHVTVYTFVPSSVRQNYDIEQLGEEKVEMFARIANYEDTWTSKADRDKIIEKLRKIEKRYAADSKAATMRFVINDRNVYSKPEQFKSKDAAAMYAKLVQTQRDIESIDKALAGERIKYHSSAESVRSKMAPEMLKKEKALEKMIETAKELRKSIINKENETLNSLKK